MSGSSTVVGSAMTSSGSWAMKAVTTPICRRLPRENVVMGTRVVELESVEQVRLDACRHSRS